MYSWGFSYLELGEAIRYTVMAASDILVDLSLHGKCFELVDGGPTCHFDFNPF